MTTKHLSGYYANGYTLSAGYSKLVIDKNADVCGSGVDVPSFATVVNLGAVYGSTQGIYLKAGGSLVNGSATNTSASIMSAYHGVEARGLISINNFGTIAAKKNHGDGVYLGAGGSLTNGLDKDRTALIQGQYAVNMVGAGTIANFGTIYGGGYFEGLGVALDSGGTLVNGSNVDSSALIRGYTGVASGGAADIANYGTIISTGRYGVTMVTGGSLTNGSAHDTVALISGLEAVAALEAVATVVNFGTIVGGELGVSLFMGGKVINGSTADIVASLSSLSVIEGSATVANFGTIGDSAGGFYGVSLNNGGVVTNGAAHDTAALVFGTLYGVVGAYHFTLANFGRIESSGLTGAGVLTLSGRIANGSAAVTTALISGATGCKMGEDATLINFGAIVGTGGVAVSMSDKTDELIAEAGSTFIGVIEGGGGRLALAGGGAGTISGFGGSGTLTGAVDAHFSGFGSYEIAAGGAWTLVGSDTLAAASVLVDEGTLINSGALTISGTLLVAASAVFRLASGEILAAQTGAAEIVDDGLMIKSPGRGTITVGAHMFDRGVVEVASGTLDFTSRLYGTGVMKIDAGATLEADAGAVSTLIVTFDGAATTLALKTPKTFAATLSGFAAGDVIDLLAIKATGAGVNGDDKLVIVDGARTVASLQLSGNYAGATFATASDGHGGTSVTLTSGGPDLPSVAGMASAMASMAAPAGVATLGCGPRAERTPVLARPNVRLQ